MLYVVAEGVADPDVKLHARTVTVLADRHKSPGDEGRSGIRRQRGLRANIFSYEVTVQGDCSNLPARRSAYPGDRAKQPSLAVPEHVNACWGNCARFNTFEQFVPRKVKAIHSR